MTASDTKVTTQVYRVYIKATPQAVWDAITKPEWSQRYGYGGFVEYEAMKKASAEMGLPVPDVTVDGEVIESDPPRKLVQTWRMLMDEALAAEGFTRLTWEIGEIEEGVSSLTVTHELEGAPKLAALLAGEQESTGAGGGWNEVLSGLKTVLETGEALRV